MVRYDSASTAYWIAALRVAATPSLSRRTINPSLAPSRQRTDATARRREPVTDTAPPAPIAVREELCNRRQLSSTRVAAAADRSTNASERNCNPWAPAAETWISAPRNSALLPREIP